MLAMRSMLCRWITTFKVSGSPSFRDSRAARSLAACAGTPATRSARLASSAWKLICTLSRPGVLEFFGRAEGSARGRW